MSLGYRIEPEENEMIERLYEEVNEKTLWELYTYISRRGRAMIRESVKRNPYSSALTLIIEHYIGERIQEVEKTVL